MLSPSPALGSWLRRIVFFVLLLALWQVLAMTGVWPDYLFPGPLAVFGALVAGFQNGLFLQASAGQPAATRDRLCHFPGHRSSARPAYRPRAPD